MRIILTFSQIIIAVLLVSSILLQQRGGGLSQVFGGAGGAYRTRRGIERGIFIATIILAVLFFATATLNIILK